MSDVPLAPVYLLSGSDRGKVRRAGERLRNRFTRDAVDLLDAATTEPAAVAGACSQQGLFAEQRLVVVEGIDAWVKPRRAGQLDALLSYIADPSPATVLALVADAPADPRKPVWPDNDPLIVAVRKASGATALLRFDAPKSAVFARQEAGRLGVRLDPEAMLRFAELVGDRPDEITRELEKIATFAQEASVDIALVEVMVMARHDDAPWALLDAITERDRRGGDRRTDAPVGRRRRAASRAAAGDAPRRTGASNRRAGRARASVARGACQAARCRPLPSSKNVGGGRTMDARRCQQRDQSNA